MQHNIQWTLFNTVIRQAMGTRSYTISCVYINMSRLKDMQHQIPNTVDIFNAVIGQAMGTRSYTINCVHINMSRLKNRRLHR